ncbi:hypothetical protein FisN_6Lh173 [Fistulifera solaris]|uniref:Uncharacterized protein n=1 Tax=Fistulifera solaris TaxID=1519565 RepID=A0A1Z5J643_FISSO|nr:hypothetical protein FisN_6Lh173 [Fistulifera solaris]|eukprot:GAX09450.1 hypothetical protein FisN_6Lh173 [Fistulifera solaris]
MPVSTEAVAFSLMEQNNKNPGAQPSSGTMTVVALDDTTARIESERPTHMMDAELGEWAFVIYSKPRTETLYSLGSLPLLSKRSKFT